MDDSTEGVTLISGFVFDVLAEYESMRVACRPAFALAAHLDPKTPGVHCEMHTYNAICDWIERELGTASVRQAGRAIGGRAFEAIAGANRLREPTPLGILDALRWAASTMIHDPKKRGWEIEDHGPGFVLMRRTQTFNRMLQEGLLLSLLERTGVRLPEVAHERCTRRGDPFCVYRCSWMANRR